MGDQEGTERDLGIRGKKSIENFTSVEPGSGHKGKIFSKNSAVSALLMSNIIQSFRNIV